MRNIQLSEAACASGVVNPEVSGYFLVFPSSNPRLLFVNSPGDVGEGGGGEGVTSQLVCLLPVGIFNYVTFTSNICYLGFSGMQPLGPESRNAPRQGD